MNDSLKESQEDHLLRGLGFESQRKFKKNSVTFILVRIHWWFVIGERYPIIIECTAHTNL